MVILLETLVESVRTSPGARYRRLRRMNQVRVWCAGHRPADAGRLPRQGEAAGAARADARRTQGSREKVVMGVSRSVRY